MGNLPMNDDPHGLRDLIDTGLLWFINTTCFHPQGFALSLVMDVEGRCVGWSMLGDGEEAISFDPNDDTVDEKFAAFHDFMDSLRPRS